MIRKLIWHLFLFALPFLIYGGWAAFVKRKKQETGGTWDEAPWMWLIIIAFSLSIGVLIAGRFLYPGDEIGGTYVPPRYEDGELIPSEVKPARPPDQPPEPQ